MSRLCEQALEDASGDGVRCARLLSVRSFAYLFGGDVARALSSGRDALASAEEVDDAALIAVAIACVGRAELYAGDADFGLLERGARIEERLVSRWSTTRARVSYSRGRSCASAGSMPPERS